MREISVNIDDCDKDPFLGEMLEKKNVLILDRNADFLPWYDFILSPQGFHLVKVRNLEDAFAANSETIFHLFILSSWGHVGHESVILDLLRKNGFGAPAILVLEDDQERKDHQNGFYDCIPKNELLHRLRNTLRSNSKIWGSDTV